MKLALLVDTWQAFTEKYINYLLGELKYEVTIFTLTDPSTVNIRDLQLHFLKNSEYLFKSANPNMYSEFFNLVEFGNYDRIICTRINFPEYFILDLESRTSFKIPASIAFYGTNEINNSDIRKLIVNKFLTLNSLNRIIVHTNSWMAVSDESFWAATNRIITIADPIYENPKDYQQWEMSTARIKLGIPEDAKVILFFGSMYFGKGLDLLLQAFNLLPNDYWLLVASSSSSLNYNFEYSSLKAERILHLNEFIPEAQVPILFSASSLVCLPYRKSYEGGTSGVLVQAALAKKPICAPNMKPFSEVIENFNVGVTFEVEDIESLTEALKSLDSTLSCSTGWNRYLSFMSTWNKIAVEYVGS